MDLHQNVEKVNGTQNIIRGGNLEYINYSASVAIKLMPVRVDSLFLRGSANTLLRIRIKKSVQVILIQKITYSMKIPLFYIHKITDIN